MGLMFLIPAGLMLCMDLFKRRSKHSAIILTRFLASGLIGGALTVILGWRMFQLSEYRYQFTIDELQQWSTSLIQYIVPFQSSALTRSSKFIYNLHASRLKTDYEGLAGGPILAYLLMLPFFVLRTKHALGPVFKGAFLLALLLSFGPRLQILDQNLLGTGFKMPLYYLYRLWHGITFLKAPGRLHVVVNLAAIFGAGWVMNHLGRRRREGQNNRANLGYGTLLLVFVIGNAVYSQSFRRTSLIPKSDVPEFYKTLRAQAGGGAVFDVPMSTFLFPKYNYYQLIHRRPAVSTTHYHDAVIPSSRRFLDDNWQMRFFSHNNRDTANGKYLAEVSDPRFTRFLGEQGIEYVIIHRDYVRYIVEEQGMPKETMSLYERLEQAWLDRLVYSDDSIHVYRTDYVPMSDALSIDRTFDNFKSHHPLESDIGGNRSFSLDADLHITFVARELPAEWIAGSAATVQSIIRNDSVFTLPKGEIRVALGYHWSNPKRTGDWRAIVWDDGNYVFLPEGLAPGESATVSLRVVAPAEPGDGWVLTLAPLLVTGQRRDWISSESLVETIDLLP